MIELRHLALRQKIVPLRDTQELTFLVGYSTIAIPEEMVRQKLITLNIPSLVPQDNDRSYLLRLQLCAGLDSQNRVHCFLKWPTTQNSKGETVALMAAKLPRFEQQAQTLVWSEQLEGWARQALMEQCMTQSRELSRKVG